MEEAIRLGLNEINPLGSAYKKRKRSNNFSSYEKTLLINLIQQYRHIITCKKTDKNTLEEKDAAWKIITNEFNSILGYDSEGSDRRTPKSLKCLYENLKKKHRDSKEPQEVVVVKQEIFEIDEEKVHVANESDASQEVPPNPVIEDEIPQTSLEEEKPAADGILQRQLNCLLVKRSNIGKKRKKVKSAVECLKIKLLRKEIELKELELKTKRILSDLEIKTQEAKLNFYRHKDELVQKCKKDCYYEHVTEFVKNHEQEM